MNLELKKHGGNVIPVFYAVDDNFIKYTMVSITSIIKNAAANRNYVFYILNTGISDEMKKEVKKLSKKNVEIVFVDIRRQVQKLNANLPLRDYYSKTTYFRFYISELFPEYDKVIYIDSDTVVLGDIAELYDTDIGENYLGACNDQVMVQTEVYGNYVEKVCGISRNNYFNAGIMLINANKFRENKVLQRFVDMLGVYSFKVTQDEDYLNVICKDNVFWLNPCWNVEVYGNLPVEEKDIKILHYIMVSKPWHYEDCRLKEYFWVYAEKTAVCDEIKKVLAAYTDDERKKDLESCDRLAELAIEEAKRLDTYVNIVNNKDPYRLKTLEKIRKYEIEGKFDVDVEDDPETIVLKACKVDYLGKKLSSKIFTKIANCVATNFFEKRIKNGELIIKDIIGLENFKTVSGGGCFITCNHFNPNDNYAVWRAIKGEFPKGKNLYKVIREGNYTNFKGMYGFFFRHCNTLPLSSNTETMIKFLKSVKILVERGEKILIYPEQAMWWNYKKPRPLKNGAFKLACKCNAPIVPAFITMEDSGKKDAAGFEIPAYTVWFLPAIYPKEDLTEKQNTEYMKEENYRVWKELYEKVYKIPLKYGE